MSNIVTRLIGSVFNALTTPTPPAPTAVQSTVPNAMGVAPSPETDPEIVRVTAGGMKALLPGYFHRAGKIGFIAVTPPRANRKHWEFIAAEAGPLFTADELSRNAAILERWNQIKKKKDELTHFKMASMRKEQNRAAVKENLGSDNPVNLTGISGHAEFQNAVTAARDVLFEEEKAVSALAAQIYRHGCDRMAGAARRIFLEREEIERGERSGFDDPENPRIFRPSDDLVIFAYIFVALARQPLVNFDLSGWICPIDLSKDPLALWLGSTPDPDQLPNGGYRLSKTINFKKSHEDVLGAAMREIDEKAKAARAIELEEKNKLVEQIKQQAIQHQADAETRAADREALKELRRQQAIARLLNPQPPAAATPPTTTEPDKPV
jgi:hypothetical protein